MDEIVNDFAVYQLSPRVARLSPPARTMKRKMSRENTLVYDLGVYDYDLPIRLRGSPSTITEPAAPAIEQVEKVIEDVNAECETSMSEYSQESYISASIRSEEMPPLTLSTATAFHSKSLSMSDSLFGSDGDTAMVRLPGLQRSTQMVLCDSPERLKLQSEHFADQGLVTSTPPRHIRRHSEPQESSPRHASVFRQSSAQAALPGLRPLILPLRVARKDTPPFTTMRSKRDGVRFEQGTFRMSKAISEILEILALDKMESGQSDRVEAYSVRSIDSRAFGFAV